MKPLILPFLFLFGIIECVAQSDSELIDTFRSLPKKELDQHYYSSVNISPTLEAIDSIHFNDVSIKSDIRMNELKPMFKLFDQQGDPLEMVFDCTDKRRSSCSFQGKFYSIYYYGSSTLTKLHVLSEVREIASLYMIDADNQTVISVPCELDGGYLPVFSSDYLVLYSSMHYDGLESIITLYKINDKNDAWLNKLEYLGSFTSSEWVIDGMYRTSKKGVFTLKIRDENQKVSFLQLATSN